LRQIHRHLEVSDGVLLALCPIPNANRMQDILDADPVDRLPTCIETPLDILHWEHVNGPLMRDQMVIHRTIFTRNSVCMGAGATINGGPAVDERVGQCLGRTFGNEHKATQSVLHDPFLQRDWSKQVTGHAMNGHGVELIRQMNHALDADDFIMGFQDLPQDLLQASPCDRLG
jgi:hypothetical protein